MGVKIVCLRKNMGALVASVLACLLCATLLPAFAVPPPDSGTAEDQKAFLEAEPLCIAEPVPTPVQARLLQHYEDLSDSLDKLLRPASLSEATLSTGAAVALDLIWELVHSCLLLQYSPEYFYNNSRPEAGSSLSMAADVLGQTARSALFSAIPAGALYWFSLYGSSLPLSSSRASWARLAMTAGTAATAYYGLFSSALWHGVNSNFSEAVARLLARDSETVLRTMLPSEMDHNGRHWFFVTRRFDNHKQYLHGVITTLLVCWNLAHRFGLRKQQDELQQAVELARQHWHDATSS